MLLDFRIESLEIQEVGPSFHLLIVASQNLGLAISANNFLDSHCLFQPLIELLHSICD